jgi:hypothetical protein
MLACRSVNAALESASTYAAERSRARLSDEALAMLLQVTLRMVNYIDTTAQRIGLQLLRCIATVVTDTSLQWHATTILWTLTCVDAGGRPGEVGKTLLRLHCDVWKLPCILRRCAYSPSPSVSLSVSLSVTLPLSLSLLSVSLSVSHFLSRSLSHSLSLSLSRSLALSPSRSLSRSRSLSSVDAHRSINRCTHSRDSPCLLACPCLLSSRRAIRGRDLPVFRILVPLTVTLLQRIESPPGALPCAVVLCVRVLGGCLVSWVAFVSTVSPLWCTVGVEPTRMRVLRGVLLS